VEETLLQIPYYPKEEGLALSLHSQYLKDSKILGKPITTLAKMHGFKAEQVYKVLLPALNDKDLGEALRFAEVGLKYAEMIDKNRLREEVGQAFVMSMDFIFSLVEEGLDSKENWIKRKAIMMHASLMDAQAEKSRFVETLMVEQKLDMIMKSRGNISSIEREVIDFEEKNGSFVQKEGV